MSTQLTKCRFGWAQVLQLTAHSLLSKGRAARMEVRGEQITCTAGKHRQQGFYSHQVKKPAKWKWGSHEITPCLQPLHIPATGCWGSSQHTVGCQVALGGLPPVSTHWGASHKEDTQGQKKRSQGKEKARAQGLSPCAMGEVQWGQAPVSPVPSCLLQNTRSQRHKTWEVAQMDHFNHATSLLS